MAHCRAGCVTMENARATSFRRLPCNQRLERVNVMTIREGEEALRRGSAVREIGPQDAFDRRRRVFGLHVAVKLAAEHGIGSEAAAGKDVVALDGIALFRGLHLASQQTDLADVVLGAGVVAAGEMDIDRPVELEACLAPTRNRFRMPLGIRGGELAAGVAGASDKAGANRACLRR